MTTGTAAFGSVQSNQPLAMCLTFLRSLKLTAVNRVFIVEPIFNPATERRAMARAVRLGQQHDISVVRYVVNHTVEQVS